MTNKGIQSMHVFSKDDRVYIKQKSLVESIESTFNKNNTVWYAVHFEWVPV